MQYIISSRANCNVFEKISRIENGQPSPVESEKAMNDKKRVEWILIAFVSLTCCAALLHILCNSSHNAKYRNDMFLAVVSEAFHDPSVVQTCLFNAGACGTALFLMINTRGSFTQFLSPLIQWSFYSLIPPAWFFIIAANDRRMTNSVVCHDVWLMLQGVSLVVPLYLIAGVVHTLDTDKKIWSRQTFLIYCCSGMGIHAIKVVTTTNLVLPHATFLAVNAMVIISWLWCNSVGVIYWFCSTHHASSLQQRNQNRLISIILSTLCVYSWVNTGVDFVSVFYVSPPAGVNVMQLRIIMWQGLATTIFTLSVMMLFARNLIEDQSKALEEVVAHHAEVFIKPGVRQAWPEEEIVGGSLRGSASIYQVW